MDTYRGIYSDLSEPGSAWPEVEFGDEEAPREPPPSPVGQDERRMQVRAYNLWASLLDNRNFPSIEDLDPTALPDFGPFSVLLDFTAGIENPSVQFLGDQLAADCGTDGAISALSDVPARSLLSRITDHYMQILANQAPIGFEAEFVNQREQTILYRGILLPFSSDDDTIDFIYGVINWKELADQKTTDDLLLEIDQALEVEPLRAPPAEPEHLDWADGPPALPARTDWSADGFASLLGTAGLSDVAAEDDDDGDKDGDENGDEDDVLGLTAVVEDHHAEVLELSSSDEAPDVELAAPGDMGLSDWLASARELADAARGSEDRTRHALYAAIGRAYDFSLAAQDAPQEFGELISDAGLTVQDRAPMTPVVKLVFGADYDKTRLTEFASALGHAQRLGLGRGALADFLRAAPGGLKGVVTEERRLKRSDSGAADLLRDTPHEALARKLRQLDHAPLDSVAAEGGEFTLLVARRLPSGDVVLLGEVGDDIGLLERAARKLL